MATITEEDESWADKVKERMSKNSLTEQTDKADATPTDLSGVATPNWEREDDPTPVIASTPQANAPDERTAISPTPRITTPSLGVTPSLQQSTRREVTPTPIAQREDNPPTPETSLRGGDSVAPVPTENDGLRRTTRERRAPAWLKDFTTEFQTLDQSLLNCQVVQKPLDYYQQSIQKPSEYKMAQAQVRMARIGQPDTIDRERRQLPDEEKELTLSGSKLDVIHISDSTKQRIANTFHDIVTADGVCRQDKCQFSSNIRRKLHEHSESHHIIYAVDCGFLTSRRDSAVKHIRTIHQKSGSITQYDSFSWPDYAKTDQQLPEDIPTLPLDARLFNDRCKKSQPMDISLTQPAAVVKVNRIKVSTQITNDQSAGNQPTSSNTPDDQTKTSHVPETEKSPLVIVQQHTSLKLQLQQRQQDLQDLKRMVDTAQKDIIRIKGQLVSIGRNSK